MEPVNTKTKERIYLLIMVFCLLMCAILLISVFCDLPIVAISEVRQPHSPAVRTTGLPTNATEPPAAQLPADGDTYKITSEYLQSQMIAYIPDSFPITAVEVEITSGGIFQLDMEVSKGDLKAYLESCGIKMGLKQTIAMGMLPDALEIEAALLCTKAGRSGIQLSVDSLAINDKTVGTGFLPENVFQVVSSSINAVLAYSGYDFSNVIFSDGAVYLK